MNHYCPNPAATQVSLVNTMMGGTMRQCLRRNLEAVQLVINLYHKKGQLFEEARELERDEEVLMNTLAYTMPRRLDSSPPESTSA
jgi:hypothetical protein